jgi:DMSO/TMAO reductase YedYZ molybdopterin-dependent catalytic subunit
MPTESHFRRDHFPVPACDQEEWRLRVTGAVAKPLTLSLSDLKAFPEHSVSAVLECAGHRRNEFDPEPAGLPWSVGAVSEAVWSGARLQDVLAEAGPQGDYVVLEGRDRGPFRGLGDFAFARALPLEKATHPDTILAATMNGHALPEGHGAPVRALVPGWYATDSVKWLSRIDVRLDPFDGPFEAIDYRVPNDDGVADRLTTIQVSSLITSLRDGDRIKAGPIELRGIAWGGEGPINQVEVSCGDEPWVPARTKPAPSRYGRYVWSFSWHAEPGRQMLAVRATDGLGRRQSKELRWNEHGYANTSIQRIAVQVE